MTVAKARSVGVAVVGSGRIGTLRASLSAAHPGVTFIAVSDKQKHKADILAQKIGADFVTTDNLAAINHPSVDAIFISTPEHDHRDAVVQALESGKPVFVEKPLSFSLEDGDAIVEAAKRTGTEIRVGYSRRHERRWMLAKEQILQGRLGEILGIQQRVYNARAQLLEILKRAPTASAVNDVLTYYVDMACWYLEGHKPVEVVAREQRRVFKSLGHDTGDVTWALVTFDNGAVVNLGVSYVLPMKYPSVGQSARFEVIGTDGVILLDADNKDSLLYTEKGAPHAYVPDHNISLMFMQTTSAADFAVGDFWGAVASETRSWLDHLMTGRPVPHTTLEEARTTLAVTLAIEESARTGKTIKL